MGTQKSARPEFPEIDHKAVNYGQYLRAVAAHADESKADLQIFCEMHFTSNGDYVAQAQTNMLEAGEADFYWVATPFLQAE